MMRRKAASQSRLSTCTGIKRENFCLYTPAATQARPIRGDTSGESAAVYCAYTSGGLHEYRRRTTRTFGHAHHHKTVPYSNELLFGGAGNECAGAVVAVRCHRTPGTVLGRGEHTGARLSNLAGADYGICRQTHNPSRCAPKRTSRPRDVLLPGAGSGHHHRGRDIRTPLCGTAWVYVDFYRCAGAAGIFDVPHRRTLAWNAYGCGDNPGHLPANGGRELCLRIRVRGAGTPRLGDAVLRYGSSLVV